MKFRQVFIPFWTSSLHWIYNKLVSVQVIRKLVSEFSWGCFSSTSDECYCYIILVSHPFEMMVEAVAPLADSEVIGLFVHVCRD